MSFAHECNSSQEESLQLRWWLMCECCVWRELDLNKTFLIKLKIIDSISNFFSRIVQFRARVMTSGAMLKLSHQVASRRWLLASKSWKPHWPSDGRLSTCSATRASDLRSARGSRSPCRYIRKCARQPGENDENTYISCRCQPKITRKTKWKTRMLKIVSIEKKTRENQRPEMRRKQTYEFTKQYRIGWKVTATDEQGELVWWGVLGWRRDEQKYFWPISPVNWPANAGNVASARFDCPNCWPPFAECLRWIVAFVRKMFVWTSGQAEGLITKE